MAIEQLLTALVAHGARRLSLAAIVERFIVPLEQLLVGSAASPVACGAQPTSASRAQFAAWDGVADNADTDMQTVRVRRRGVGASALMSARARARSSA